MSKAKYISKLVDASGSTTSANVSYTGTLTGSTDILNIGSGQLYKDASGNVGIGVTDFSSTGANAKFAISLGGINLDDAKVLSWGGGSARPYITASKSSAYLAMGVSGTERMRIDSSGNVGIGTSSPAGAKLRLNQPSGVYGPSTPLQSWAYANAQVTNLQIDGSVNPVWNTDADSTWAQTATMIWQYRGSEKMRIDSSGNVGIGTSSPSSKLDITWTANAGIRLSDGTVTGVIYNTGGNSMGIGLVTNHPMVLYTNDTERMRIDSSGNLLLGATSGSGQKLYIAKNIIGNTNITVANSYLYMRGADIGYATGFSSTTSGVQVIQTYLNDSAGGLDLALNPSGGNVGIGTSSPTCRLDVFGGYISTANTQLAIGNVLTTTASLVAGNWYRIATFPASNQGQSAEIHIRHGSTHNNTIIKVSKGTGQWRAEVCRAGYYVNPTQTPTYPAINKVRIYDIGVNNVTHIDIQILGNTSSQTYNVIVKNNISDVPANRLTLVALTDQGTTAAGVEFQSIGTMASWGNNNGQLVTFDESGNVGIAGSLSGSWSSIPTGTVMVFVQSTAPTGWTKSTTNNDKSLRVVSGSTGGSAGGTVAFSTAFASQTPSGSVSTSITGISASIGSTTLTASQIPSHQHGYQIAYKLGGSPGTTGEGICGAGPQYAVNSYNAAPGQSTDTGGVGNTGHNHSFAFSSGTASSAFTGTAINLAVQYVDVIICTKN